MAFQATSRTKTVPDPIYVEPEIKLEELPGEVEAGPSARALVKVKKPILKPIKTKLCLKKADVRQCRLCLRVLPREDVRETTTPGSDIRRKIQDAVAVTITSEDKVKTVCINCLLLVDMIYEFRMACRKANTLHTVKLLMMHPGGWMNEETKTAIETCHKVVKRNRAEMDGLFKCSWVGSDSTIKDKEFKEAKVLDDGDAAPSVKQEEVSDSDPEISEKFGQVVDRQKQLGMDVEAAPKEAPREKKKRALHFMCDICGSSVMYNCAEHHKNKHLGVRPYSCDVDGCKATFYSQKSKRQHAHSKWTMHVPDDPETRFECEVCHRMIKGTKGIRAHMRYQHSDKPEHPLKKQCPICGKYYYKVYFKDHVAMHKGEQSYECEFCDRKFTAYNSWSFHKRKYHAEELGLQQD